MNLFLIKKLFFPIIVVILLTYNISLRYQLKTCKLESVKSIATLNYQNQALLERSKQDELKIKNQKENINKSIKLHKKNKEEEILLLGVEVPKDCESAIAWAVDSVSKLN